MNVMTMSDPDQQPPSLLVYVVCRIEPDSSSTPCRILSQLTREVAIMKRMDHPNIVKLFEVIETDSTLYLVMEYAAGGAFPSIPYPLTPTQQDYALCPNAGPRVILTTLV